MARVFIDLTKNPNLLSNESLLENQRKRDFEEKLFRQQKAQKDQELLLTLAQLNPEILNDPRSLNRSLQLAQRGQGVVFPTPSFAEPFAQAFRPFRASSDLRGPSPTGFRPTLNVIPENKPQPVDNTGFGFANPSRFEKELAPRQDQDIFTIDPASGKFTRAGAVPEGSQILPLQPSQSVRSLNTKTGELSEPQELRPGEKVIEISGETERTPTAKELTRTDAKQLALNILKSGFYIDQDGRQQVIRTQADAVGFLNRKDFAGKGVDVLNDPDIRSEIEKLKPGEITRGFNRPFNLFQKPSTTNIEPTSANIEQTSASSRGETVPSSDLGTQSNPFPSKEEVIKANLNNSLVPGTTAYYLENGKLWRVDIL